MFHVLLVLRVLPEQEVREKPFTDEEPLLAKLVVHREVELVGEVKVQVMALHIPAVRFHQGGQGPKLDRWVDMKPKGHID
jgi:hypothetical protein